MHPSLERETAGKPSGSVAYPDNATKTLGTCPVCEKAKLDVTRKPGRQDHWIDCWSCQAAGLDGREYWLALLEAIGAGPNQMGQMRHEGPAFEPLRPWLERSLAFPHGLLPGGRSEQVELPSVGSVHGWASALLASGEPLRYLVERRQLSHEILERFRVGWDTDRGDLTFPIVGDDGAPVYLLRRKPFDRAKVRARGRPRPVYPNVPERGPLCLVEGEIDALTGRQIGLRTIALGGKRLSAHAQRVLAGRTASVMFDVGAEEAAEHVSQLLRAAGGTAWVVRLALLGLPEDADLNDYHRDGGSIAELRNLIKSERSAS